MLTANDLEIDEVMGAFPGGGRLCDKALFLAVFGRAFRSFGALPKQASRIYEIGELRLDFEKLLFYRGEEELSLSRNEQKLLRLFVENQGSFCQENG